MKIVNLTTRKEMSKALARRYQRARKKEKTEILNVFVKMTGYHRVYARWLLRNWGKKIEVRREGGKKIILVGEVGKKIKRKKSRKYGEEVRKVVVKIWKILDFPCGKRLKSILPEMVRVLEREKELKIDPEVKEKVNQISSATLDRILKEERKKWDIKKLKKGSTKPGSLLKSQIPVRTFAEWDDKRPGFVEIDLVSHDGGNVRGDYLHTLDVTDVATGWTETQAVKNKAQIWVFEALKDIIERMPFPILGIDSDNGSEFINAHLLRFCEEKGITFTRTRPYRKNDNCYVEQKNYSVVRKTVGYYRYDTEVELNLINQLYRILRLYTNFFQPSMKLIEKTRIGSKVKKKYDTPKTPYQRVLESPFVSEQVKEELKRLYETLNPAKLKRELVRIQNRLFQRVSWKMERERRRENVYDLEKIFV